MTDPTDGAVCGRQDCRGEGLGRINARGFCSECGRRPLPAAPSPAPPPVEPAAPLVSESTATTARARRRDVARKFTVRPRARACWTCPASNCPRCATW
ncbi:hypothetical protein ACFQ10_31235 [Streptomyces indonesiensis]